MINNIQDDVKKSDTKFFFIRVKETEYRRIEELAKVEDRSINQMAVVLLKRALDEK